MSRQIFSDSWHIVANLKVSLLHSVMVQKQFFRGDEWYVINDSFNNKFFRVKMEAYKFLVRLNTKQSVEEIWEEYLTLFPDIAPTQEEVVKLLSSLHINNLLYFKNTPKSADIFDRYVEYKNKMLKSKIAGFLFIKIPLFDPNKFLKIVQPISSKIFSIYGFIFWLIVILYGIKTIIDNSSSLFFQAQGVLSPSNLIYLYISLFFLKVLHEFGHSIICKNLGGPVHTIGVMFLVFTPLPYMDASSSWAFKNKWHRALVGSAGMLVELFIAALAAIVWANTGEGFIHNMSFNIMIIGSISTLVFNGNPLLRFDAYYMLSDILEIPNLAQRSKEQIYYFVEKYIFNIKETFSPSYSIKEAFWLIIYFISSSFYRVLITVAIIIFVSDKILIVGVIVIIISLFMWVLKPIYSFFVYLFTNQKLNKNRYRAISITFLFISLVILIVGVIPVPNSIRAPGIVYSKEFTKVYTPNEGYIKKIYFKSGEEVKRGDLLIEVSNLEIDLDINETKSKLEEALALKLNAQKNIADLKALKERVKLLEEKLAIYENRKKELLIYANTSGVWISPKLTSLKNSLLKKREHLGYIIPKSGFKFIAVVNQENAFDLFKESSLKGEIKLYGASSQTINVNNIYVIPYEKQNLPSAALGWLGGGDIQVAQDDPSGTKSIEAFFEIRAFIVEDENRPLLLHERVGILRINLPNSPIGFQLIKAIKQLMQKRYQI